MKKNKEMLMLAGINEATNIATKCGNLEAVLWQMRSSLNIALGVVEGRIGSKSDWDPHVTADFLKNAVREALDVSERMEKKYKDSDHPST